jgi:hypothetical protein
MSDRLMIRTFMAGLVERAGGVDAAAALIGARLGDEVSKGSISKRLAGHLDWPLVEIMALEDAVGDPCVRRWLARSLPELAEGRSLMQAAAETVRENGEAVSAVMDFAAGRGSKARARKEVSDLVTASARLAALMEGTDDTA